MKRNILLHVATILVLFIISVNGAFLRNIDNFTPDVNRTLNDANFFPNVDNETFLITQGDDTIGTERDMILFLDGSEIYFKQVSSQVQDGTWSIGWGQQILGYATLQFDGVDGSPNLNVTPGLAGVDITSGSAAYAFVLQISSDHPAPYVIDVYGAAPTHSVYTFTCPATANSVGYDLFVIPYTLFSGNADFTAIHAIELTLNISDATVSNAIDSSVFTFATFGYVVNGYAYRDCNSNGLMDTNELGIANATVQLKTVPANTVFRTTTTDANGFFSFVELGNTTYNVCVSGLPVGLTNTQPASGCRVVVLNNLVDATGLLFGYTAANAISLPPNVTVDACGCTTPNCTGNATSVSCNNGVVLYNDTTTSTECPQIITRTWYINGTTTKGNQIITVRDVTAPFIVDQAAKQNVSCSLQNPTLSSWVGAHGYANATDCHNFGWTSNWNGVTPRNCGTVSVIFFANDTCGNVNTTSSTWTVYDGVPPTFDTNPSSPSVQCNSQTNSDLNAFQTWLNNFGDAKVSDNCETSLNLTNNYLGGFTRPTVCNSSVTVTFTANDKCGSFATAQGTFTIFDDQLPFVSLAPQNSGAECKGDGSALNAFNAWVATHGNASVTDACTSVDWSSNASVPILGCNQNNIVQFVAQDKCGLSRTFTANFLIFDTKGPNITTNPQPLSVNCSSDTATAFTNWLGVHANAVATDDCTGSSVTWSNNANLGNPLPQCGSVSVSFTASDACAVTHSTTAAGTFTVYDDQPPVFTTLPSDKQVLCNSDITAQFNQWITSNGNSTVSDNCASFVGVTNDFPVNGTIPSLCHTNVTVRFTASDGCNNLVSAPAVFSVIDTTPPAINPTAKDFYQECNVSTNQPNYSNWLNTRGGANATDPCGGVVWTNNATSKFISSACSDVRPVTFTATDSCGLFSTTTATFNLTDTLFPTLLTPANNRNAECDGTGNVADFNNWRALHANFTAVDACWAIQWSDNFTAISPFVNCVSTTTLTFIASDQCGHSISQTASYIITDTAPPFFTQLPQDDSAECDGQGNTGAIQAWLDSHGNSSASDLCNLSALKWTNTYNTSISTCRTVNVIFTATDSCGYNVSASANFTVTDKTKPVFNPAVANVSVQCDGAGNVDDYQTWVSTMGGANASDVCAARLTYANTAPAVGPVGCGTVRATFLATDQCNNTGFSVGTYTVIDSFPPSIVTQPSDYTAECDGTGNVVELNTWLLDNGGAEADDTCSPNQLYWANNFRRLTAISNCTSLATVTFTVFDTCNNTDFATATFITVDTQPPVIFPSASNLTLQCDVALNPAQIQSYLTNNGGAAAVDVCSPTVIWTDDFEALTDSCGNGVVVTFTVADICGNAASTTAYIQVIDNVKPRFTSFPANANLSCGACQTPDCTGIPLVSDDCSSASELSLTFTDYSFTMVDLGFCPGDKVITRVWNATDPCGNTVTRNQTLIVQRAPATGPCVPTLCPPCDESQAVCCESNSAPQACNAVSCKPVTCLQVPCTPVECIPQVCETFPVTPTPTPAAAAPTQKEYYNACEPVYVYVYNDDGVDDEQDNQPVIKYIYEYIYGLDSVVQYTTNAASVPSLLMSFTLLSISLFLF